jgi:hypothetical protein
MSLFEKMIEKAERTLKEMSETPDPTQLRSARLGLELELSGYKEMLDGWQNGKPLLPYFPSSNLARALGSMNITYADVFLFIQVFDEIPRYMQAAVRLGMPEYMCDLLDLPTAAAVLGDLPPTSLGIVCSYGTCHVWPYHLKVLAEHSNAPIFEIDTPQNYSEDSVKYVAAQLAELVKFAEANVPGLKYDEEKHRSLIETNRIWVDYCNKDWELRKHVPLPMNNKDVIVVPYHFEPSLYAEGDKVLEFWRVRTEEIEARAKSGFDREEKLRILWVIPPPLYIDALGILERRGVSVPGLVLPPDLLYYGKIPNCWGDDKEFGRKLSPLEEEARVMIGAGIQGEGMGWADAVAWMCQDLQCDAAIFFEFTSCVHHCSLARLVSERLEKKLGIPTLILRTKNFDSALLPPDQFESTLLQFVDIVEARKQKA